MTIFEHTHLFFYMMAHWAFSAQYWKTSMTLPKVLSEAKLEWASQDTHNENRVSRSS